jgi:hypothetical protein
MILKWDKSYKKTLNLPSCLSLGTWSFFGQEREMLTKLIIEGGLGYTFNPEQMNLCEIRFC